MVLLRNRCLCSRMGLLSFSNKSVTGLLGSKGPLGYCTMPLLENIEMRRWLSYPQQINWINAGYYSKFTASSYTELII